MLAVAARHGQLEQTCKLCRTSSELRKKWGCDKPVEKPLFMLECVRCNGPGQDPNCGLCKGTGLEPIYRCPWKIMSSEVGQMYELYDLVQRGVGLPSSGGTQDQSAVFLEAMRLIKIEEGRYEQEKNRRGHN